MPVNLDALLTELEGIGKTNPDNWYRAHGSEGLEDFRKTGEVRAKPGGRYSSTYYSKSGPESRYMPKGGGSIVEALPKTGVEAIIDSRRYGITEQGKPLTKKDWIRIYEKMQNGGYKVVYDNINPLKHGARFLRDSVTPPALALNTIESAIGSYGTPTEAYEDRLGVIGLKGAPARIAGVFQDLGNNLTFDMAEKLGSYLGVSAYDLMEVFQRRNNSGLAGLKDK